MDAVKFLEERKRMFKNGNPVPGLDIDITYNTEKVVKIVEEWSAAHPRKTRQSVFLEQYPEASCVDNILMSCPKVIDKNFSCSNTCFNCADCRRDFWMQEVE